MFKGSYYFQPGKPHLRGGAPKWTLREAAEEFGIEHRVLSNLFRTRVGEPPKPVFVLARGRCYYDSIALREWWLRYQLL